MELSTRKDADQIFHMLSSATARGQAVFYGGGNVTIRASKSLGEGIKTKGPRKPNRRVVGSDW